MNRTLVADLGEHVGERATVRGWVHALRDQKSVQFVIVRDETGLAQAVLPKEEPPGELNEAVSALTAESAVTITGSVVADERVNLGGLELRIEDLRVDSAAEPELPVAPDSALDKRIDWRYLDLRQPERKLIFEVQTAVEHAMREFWIAERFIEIHTPKLMGSKWPSAMTASSSSPASTGYAANARSPQRESHVRLATRSSAETSFTTSGARWRATQPTPPTS